MEFSVIIQLVSTAVRMGWFHGCSYLYTTLGADERRVYFHGQLSTLRAPELCPGRPGEVIALTEREQGCRTRCAEDVPLGCCCVVLFRVATMHGSVSRSGGTDRHRGRHKPRDRHRHRRRCKSITKARPKGRGVTKKNKTKKIFPRHHRKYIIEQGCKHNTKTRFHEWK